MSRVDLSPLTQSLLLPTLILGRLFLVLGSSLLFSCLSLNFFFLFLFLLPEDPADDLEDLVYLMAGFPVVTVLTIQPVPKL